jgi:hypothetical protein
MDEQHPPPWKLIPGHNREYEGSNMGWIEDANGKVICDFGDDTQYYPSEGFPPSGPVAASILAAPEMEALLREVEHVSGEAEMGWTQPRCHFCEAFEDQPHAADCKLDALLARIDAAKAKPKETVGR